MPLAPANELAPVVPKAVSAALFSSARASFVVSTSSAPAADAQSTDPRSNDLPPKLIVPDRPSWPLAMAKPLATEALMVRAALAPSVAAEA